MTAYEPSPEVVETATQHRLTTSASNSPQQRGRWTCVCGQLLARIPDGEVALFQHRLAVAYPAIRAEVLAPVAALLDRIASGDTIGDLLPRRRVVTDLRAVLGDPDAGAAPSKCAWKCHHPECEPIDAVAKHNAAIRADERCWRSECRVACGYPNVCDGYARLPRTTEGTD